MTTALGDDRPTRSGSVRTRSLPSHLPIAADLTYAFDPAEVHLSDGRFATAATHVTFDGTPNGPSGRTSEFHVTSADWQESQVRGI
jgi:hypothetical protein